ncbi:MAG: ABC transporter permease [Anaerolineaceae bacterium]|nr:ABC transporter permease [Anaerolineaceae bacterium]
MLRFIGKRILLMLPTLVIVSLIGFLIIQAPPGDYVTSYVAAMQAQGDLVDQDEVEGLRARFGLDQPIYVQYWRWASNFLRGELGYSLALHQPVAEIVKSRLPASFAITLLSMLLVYAIGIPIGILSATKQYSIQDYVFTVIGFLGVATPRFMLALVGLWAIYQSTGKAALGLYSTPAMQNAPFSLAKGLDLLSHLWLPALITGMAGTAGLIRTMRANLLDELPKPYVTVARARGVAPTKLLYKYPLRIALNPVISTIGYTLPHLLEGEVLVSLVLGLPTLAPVLLSSLLQQDMLLAASIIMIEAVLVLIGTLISDMLLAVVDPRIRGSI